MNTNKMTVRIVDTSQRRVARVAGFAYLFLVIGSILNWTFVYSKLIVAGNVIATANNINANELLFRIGITCDLMQSINVIALAWAHFIILKSVNKNLALFALFLKLAEAILLAVIILFSFIALQILNVKAYLTVFKPEQFQALAGLFLNVHNAVYTIPMVFSGLGFIVFLYLLFNSKYVPRILSGFGILSYLPMVIYTFVNILVAKPATILVDNFEMIFYVPSILFEIIIGLWLLIKGVNIQQGDNRAPASL